MEEQKKLSVQFTKMHGCGNDYIYIHASGAAIPEERKEAVVRQLSDRHFGIGGDGVIFIHTLGEDCPEADFEMEMYNADGSRAQMCGNGIRCVAKYVYDKGLTHQEQIRIMSCGTVRILDLEIQNGKVSRVRVNMGRPVLNAGQIPVKSDQEQVIGEEIEVAGSRWQMTCVSMGNPHAVVMAEEPSTLDLEKIGPCFEHHQRFPERINTEFIKVIDEETIEMRVWERGSGETLACGTGACAAVVACVLNGLTKEKVTVKLLGGELIIHWDRQADTVIMSGPAEIVFEGTIELT